MIIINVNVRVTLANFIKKNIRCPQCFPVIELYSDLINKKNCLSQIQDKSRFFVTVFGNSKRIYDVERGSSFLDSARF